MSDNEMLKIVFGLFLILNVVGNSEQSTCSNVLETCKVKCISYLVNEKGCATCECDDMKDDFFEGDIALDVPSRIQLKTVLNGNMFARAASVYRTRWTKYLSGSTYYIPYVISQYMPTATSNLIKDAFEEYKTHTCIRFKPWTGENNYIFFKYSRGCWSYVGMRYEAHNDISIGRGCEKLGTVLHEIMHALGFWHEHSRPDRDEHIKIHHDNIRMDAIGNFQKRSQFEVNSLGISYDTGSVMQYSGKAFSKNGKSTITDLFGNPVLAQREKFAWTDIAQINRMYNCQIQNIVSTTTTPNEWTTTTTRPTTTTTTTSRKTNITPPMRVKPTAEMCLDQRTVCGKLAIKGFCETSIKYMAKNCRKSCNFC